MTIEKIIKQHNFIKLVKTNEITGGNYAIINGDKAKTGLTLDAANELFLILKKISN